MARVGGAHHVLRVEALLGQLWHGQCAVLLRSAGREWREANHEEVEARERHHVHRQLAEVAVKLAGETQRASGAANGCRHQVVQVAVGRRGELERAEADVVKRLVVEGEALVGVFHQLVHGQRGVVGLNDGVGHLGGRDDRVGRHDTVGVLLAHLLNGRARENGGRFGEQGLRQFHNATKPSNISPIEYRESDGNVFYCGTTQQSSSKHANNDGTDKSGTKD